LLSALSFHFPLKTRRIADCLAKARLGHTLAFETKRETEIANDLRIEICKFGWAHQCRSNQQALARFQNKKKERAVNLLRVA
jgi:hypothetical protein